MKKTTPIALLTCAIMLFGCNNRPQNPEPVMPEESEEPAREITYTTYSAGDSNNAYLIRYQATLPELEDDFAVENIRTTLMGVFNAPNANDPQTALERHMQQTKIEFTEMHNQMITDDVWDFDPPQLESCATITHLSSNKYFSTYVVSASYYGGGAHGGFNKSYMVFDNSTGKQITEKSFLTNKSAVTNLLRTTALKQYIRENSEFEVFDKDYITANGNFFFTPDSLVYQYGEYEIAAYCFGRPMFRLHKNDVKQYLNPDSPVYKYWFGE